MSDSLSDLPESERTYPIRIVRPATNDITEAYNRLVSLSDTEHAEIWKAGLFQAIRALANMPRKHPIAERESQLLGVEVRQLVYQRQGSSFAHRVLFTIVQMKDEPSFVRILHIRHAARRPMTRKEATTLSEAIQADL